MPGCRGDPCGRPVQADVMDSLTIRSGARGAHARATTRVAPTGQLASAAVTDRDGLLRNSNYAFDATHNATDHTAHHPTNDGANRTGGALTDGDALLASTHNALGLRRERRRNSGNNDDSYRELRLHEQTPPPDVCGSTTDAMDLVSPLWRQREANVA